MVKIKWSNPAAAAGTLRGGRCMVGSAPAEGARLAAAAAPALSAAQWSGTHFHPPGAAKVLGWEPEAVQPRAAAGIHAEGCRLVCR